MSLDAKLDTISQNSTYVGPAVIAGGSILTFNQWMGLLGLLFSVLLGVATFLFTVKIQKRREVREIELHNIRVRNEMAVQLSKDKDEATK